MMTRRFTAALALLWTAALPLRAEERQSFLSEFLRLPPHERVQQWRHETSVGAESNDRVWRQKTDGLIAFGVDAVPELVSIIRRDKPFYQIQAVEVLAKMDRYVPAKETPLPTIDGTTRSEALNINGFVNPFVQVDGHRIGKEGLEAILWAGNQTGNRNLRLLARNYSGLSRAEIDALPLDAKVAQWRTEAKETSAGFDFSSPHIYVFHELSMSLVERNGWSAVQPITDILNSDRNEVVKRAAIGLLKDVDACHTRLRSREAGKKSIEAVRSVLQTTQLKSVYPTEKIRQMIWDGFSGQVLHDDLSLDRNSNLYVIAAAFEQFYGEHLIFRTSMGDIPQEQASAELQKFVTYLTGIDASFPSWEYPYCGFYPRTQILHPGFKKKMNRYYEQWKKFKTTIH